MQITLEQLTKVMPYGKKRLPDFITHLNKYMPKYGINTPERAAAFLAQLAHESGEFRYMQELASGEAYDTGKLAIALGNTPEDDDDGRKYKGHGPIQITGKANHRRASRALFGDERLLDKPLLLTEPEWGVASACWFWSDKNLNALADTGDFKTITKRINGGFNGLEDRLKYWKTAKTVLGVKG